MRQARDWAASVAGRTLTRLVWRAGNSAELFVTSAIPELDDGRSCAPLAALLLRQAATGHVIVPFWSAHQVTIALLAAERFGLRPALARFEVVADDSFGGEMMRHLGDRIGLKMRRIHARGNARRLQDINEWIRDPAPFFIAVDGGSRYGTVPTGIVRLAARLDSTVLPLAVRARPCVRLPGLIAELPLRGAVVALSVATPLRSARGCSVVGAAEDLRQRLDSASAAAAALLAERGNDQALERGAERKTA